MAISRTSQTHYQVSFIAPHPDFRAVARYRTTVSSGRLPIITMPADCSPPILGKTVIISPAKNERFFIPEFFSGYAASLPAILNGRSVQVVTTEYTAGVFDAKTDQLLAVIDGYAGSFWNEGGRWSRHPGRDSFSYHAGHYYHGDGLPRLSLFPKGGWWASPPLEMDFSLDGTFIKGRSFPSDHKQMPVSRFPFALASHNEKLQASDFSIQQAIPICKALKIVQKHLGEDSLRTHLNEYFKYLKCSRESKTMDFLSSAAVSLGLCLIISNYSLPIAICLITNAILMQAYNLSRKRAINHIYKEITALTNLIFEELVQEGQLNYIAEELDRLPNGQAMEILIIIKQPGIREQIRAKVQEIRRGRTPIDD